MGVRSNKRSAKAKNNDIKTSLSNNETIKKVVKIGNANIQNEESDKDIIIKKLLKEKEDLENEFTEILESILKDLKKQEEFIADRMTNDEPNNEIMNHYKNKYMELKKQIELLEDQNQKLKGRIHALEYSTLGRLTVKYWSWKKGKNKKQR